MIEEVFISTRNLIDKYLYWIILLEKWEKHYPKSEYLLNVDFNRGSSGGMITIVCNKK